MIKINEKYSIDTSGDGCKLKTTMAKQREEVVDKVKTGNVIDYIANDIYYHSTVEQCLNKILMLELEDTEDIKGVLAKIDEVKILIKGLTTWAIPAQPASRRPGCYSEFQKNTWLLPSI